MSNKKRELRPSARKKATLETKKAIQQQEIPPVSNHAPTEPADAAQVAKDLYASVLRQLEQNGPEVKAFFWRLVCHGEGTEAMREVVTLSMKLQRLNDKPERYPGRLLRVLRLIDQHGRKWHVIAAIMRADKDHPEWAWVKCKNGTQRPIRGEDVRAMVNDLERKRILTEDSEPYPDSVDIWAGFAFMLRQVIKTHASRRKA
jgi:hypothetical protein